MKKINHCKMYSNEEECMILQMNGKDACHGCSHNIGGEVMWISKFKESEINDSFGFVYIITNMKTNKFYIGKKQVKSVRRVVIGKREKALTKTRKKYKEVIKPMDWKNYYGSSLELKKDIAKFGKGVFRREILLLARDKRELTYLETKLQFKFNVLDVDSYNENILGKFYKRKEDDK